VALRFAMEEDVASSSLSSTSSTIPAENSSATAMQEAENGGEDVDTAQSASNEQEDPEGPTPNREQPLEGLQEQQRPLENEDVTYIGKVRRWCKGHPGEPAWGLVYSKVHCTDFILVDEDGDKFSEGDLISFKEVAEEGCSRAEEACLINYEELQDLEEKLAKVMTEQPSKHTQVVELEDSRYIRHEEDGHPGATMQVATQYPPSHGQMSHNGMAAAAMRDAYEHQQMPYNRLGNLAYPAGHAQPSGQPPRPPPPPLQLQQQPQQQPPVPASPRKPDHMVLVEPPPMLAQFDAKACALCLKTNLWQGNRTGSPRKWGASPTVNSVGQMWFEALQQGIAAAHASQAAEADQQVQHSNWGGEHVSQSWGMWHAGNQHSMDAVHGVGENYSGQMMGHEPAHSWGMQQWSNVA